MSALNLAQSLIRIKSISPNDAGCFEVIEPELSSLGFKVEKIRELNSETLLAKFGNKGKIFCYLGHTDVVPSGPIEEWSSHPFEANVVNDELIGRGGQPPHRAEHSRCCSGSAPLGAHAGGGASAGL